MSRRCPHADVQHCPLYHAAHIGNGLGCDDGRLEEQSCAVARGMSYEQNRELLRVKEPGLVERCEWNETAAARRMQMTRNLRMNGIH